MEPNRDITEILAVNFPVGQSRSLDILIKYTEDEECYAMNHESYNFKDLKNPRFRLPKGTLRGVVRVQAPYVDCTVTIDFVNDGAESSVRALHWNLRDDIATLHVAQQYP